MKTHSPLLSHRTILMIAIFAITPTIIASVFIMPDSKPYSILLISLLTAFCIIILVKIKIKNKSLSQHYYDSKTSKPDTTDKFLFEQLYIRNCNPKKDNDAIIFHHKNGTFKAEWLDHKVIRIIFPQIFAAPPSHLNKLIKAANQINIDYVLVKVVAVPRSDNSEILIHAIADFYYTSQNKDTSLLDEILTQFIEIQTDFIKEIISINEEKHNTSSPLLTDIIFN